MIVGTSTVVAKPMKAALSSTPGVSVTVETRDGIEAVSRLRLGHVDVIFIDIGDPNVKPGIDLKRLLKVDPDAKIVMVATLTFANVKNATQGLVNGAAEFVQAPSSHTRHISPEAFHRQLSDLALNLGKARRQKGERAITKPETRHEYPVPSELRPRRLFIPKAIAVASSTGGPQALFKLFSALPRDLPQPVFLTQHMPAGFTKSLAEHIDQRSGWPCKEAEDGDLVEGGRISLAPGDFHLIVENGSRGPTIRINQSPKENFCRPSAEPMLRTMAEVYGPENLLLIVLTGMGADGKAGAEMIADAGGTVIVQDKDTSVVWGMPGAIADAGACHAILPIEEIGQFAGRVGKGQ